MSAASTTTAVSQLTELPELTTVYQVIRTLYHDSNSESKEAASKWLGLLQNSIYAWKIADDLLIARYDVETCYFAAQTLRTKLQSSFHELPAESYSSLKDSIINHLKTIKESVIQTQLALAITYFAILVSSWTNPIEELVSKDLDRIVIVEILMLLPEELDQSRHQTLRGVGASRRQQFTKYLSSIAPQIISLLSTTLQENQLNNSQPSQKDRIVSKVYRCLGAWFQTIEASNISLIEPILSSIFESLSQPECSDVVHDAASDTICSAALLCEDYQPYQQLTHYLLNHIYQLEIVYHHSVANEDLDKSINYSRIFTEIAESVVDPLIINCTDAFSAGASASKLVDLLLIAIGHYDYEVAEITFHFWYRFSELVSKKGGEVINIFGPIANRLLTGLTKHCQLESDQDGLLSTESDLYDFRLRVRDLMKEMIFIIGAPAYLRQNDVIQRIDSSLQRLLNPQSQGSNWETVEAELYVLSCIARDSYGDDEIVAEIIKLVIATSQTDGVKVHPQVLATCCVILGELSDWLERNPLYLDPVLNYLLGIITSSPPTVPESSTSLDSKNSEPVSLSSVAAAALQPIVGSCASKHLVGNWGLISILIQICSQLDLIQNENAAHNLLQCCSTIISTSHNNQTREQLEDVVVQLLVPNMSRLKEILTTQTSDATAKKDPVIYLDRTAATFRNLKLKPAQELNIHSMLNSAISDQLWPLIKTLLNSYASAGDTRIVERTCRCLRFIIRSVRPSWLLQDIATVVCSLYQQYPKHSSFLYLASIVVDEFAGPDDLPGVAPQQQLDISSGLISMLNAFCMTTFQLLTAPSTQLRNHPDTIDDFFRLCTRFLQKRGDKFLRESMLSSILDLSIAALQLDHREANGSVTKFLIELFDSAEPKSSIGVDAKNIVAKMIQDQVGQRLMNAVINCAFFTLPSHFVPDMADVLWALLTYNREETVKWLTNCLKSPPTQDKPGVVAATPEQLHEFLLEMAKASHPKYVAQSLRYVSRLYR